MLVGDVAYHSCPNGVVKQLYSLGPIVVCRERICYVRHCLATKEAAGVYLKVVRSVLYDYVFLERFAKLKELAELCLLDVGEALPAAGAWTSVAGTWFGRGTEIDTINTDVDLGCGEKRGIES